MFINSDYLSKKGQSEFDVICKGSDQNSCLQSSTESASKQDAEKLVTKKTGSLDFFEAPPASPGQ